MQMQLNPGCLVYTTRVTLDRHLRISGAGAYRVQVEC